MKNKNMENIKGSCFCLLLLTIVIVYLSIKPEGFKEGHNIRYRHSHYGTDVSDNDISDNDISHNHIKYVFIDTTEKEKEREVIKPGITQIQTQSQPQPVQTKTDLENILDWFNVNKFTNADLALFAIVFVLFIIIMFIIIKLSQT